MANHDLLDHIRCGIIPNSLQNIALFALLKPATTNGRSTV